MRDTSNLENPSSHLAIEPSHRILRHGPSSSNRCRRTRLYLFSPATFSFPSLPPSQRLHGTHAPAATPSAQEITTPPTTDPLVQNGANTNQTMVMWDSQNRSYIVVEPSHIVIRDLLGLHHPDHNDLSPLWRKAGKFLGTRESHVTHSQDKPRTPEPWTLHPVSNQRSHRPRSRRTPEHTTGIRSVSRNSRSALHQSYAAAALLTQLQLQDYQPQDAPSSMPPQRTVIDITNENEAPVENHSYHARTHRPHVAADLATQVEDNEDNPTRQRTSELSKQLRSLSTCFSFVIFCFEFVNFKYSREAMLQGLRLLHGYFLFLFPSIPVFPSTCYPYPASVATPYGTYHSTCCATYHVLPYLTSLEYWSVHNILYSI